MEKQENDMTWGQLGCLWVTLILLCGAVWIWGCPRRKELTEAEKAREKVADAEFDARMQKLKQELEDPKVKAAFQAGWQFGAKHKATGLTKLAEADLDGYALEACRIIKVPPDLKGHAVRKFKSGYGWGYFQGQ